MRTLFISDLHLDARLPHLTDLFTHFMREQIGDADALYILGDLFEVWVGDDDNRPEIEQFIQIIADVVSSGVSVYVMHGNRDFLIGKDFAQRTGCTLLEDPTVIDLYGQPTLLLHGDSLCTADVEHQKSRVILRSPAWQQAFLQESLDSRIEKAQAYRNMSRSHLQNDSNAIIDVDEDTVKAHMHTHHVSQMIHGHTHRPAVHQVDLETGPARRIVLGDWDKTGSVLVCNQQGCQLEIVSN